MEKAGQEVKESIEYLKLEEIHPSDNYRKTMDKAKLAELTDSIKEHGVLQPITVRRNAKGYEIVYGERRWRAAKAAGLETIPSIVRTLTDDQALEMAVVENDQREDPNPMDQATGYKLLLDRGRHNVETLMAKLDKSRDYVEGRLRLLRLPKEVQDRLRDGTIPVSHGLVLTRLKNDGDMKKLAKEIIDEDMTLGDVKRSLGEYSTEMAKAVFDTAACASCPARSRAQVALFPDAKQEGDRCMDRSCFFAKTREHYKQYAVELGKIGVKVYTREQDFDAAKKKAGHTACEITTSTQGYHYGAPYPKLWRTQCAKCGKRAFGWWEKNVWQGKVIESNWLCLERKCLDKMNRVRTPAAAPNDGFHRQEGRRSSPEHAIACRDRFLYREVAPRVEKSEGLRMRLAIYHLLEHFDDMNGSVHQDDKAPESYDTREALFHEITAQKLGSNKYSGRSWFTSEDYAAIAAIPEKKLTEVLLKVALASVQYTEPEVLLLMTPEAGIDLNKSLLIDKTYLDTKTKGDLAKLARSFGINARTTSYGKPLDQLSKSEIVDEIMKHDLTGQLPKDIADRCELKVLAKMSGKKTKKGARKK